MSESTDTPGAGQRTAGRIAIVANQTIAGAALERVVRRRIAAGQDAFVLLVPVANFMTRTVASPGAVESGIPMMTTQEIDYERKLGEQRLAHGLEWLEGLGATATGEVILSVDAVDRLRQLVAAGEASAVIVSTLPNRLSKWLRQDLPRRIERKIDVPVEVVTPADC